jgi:hypothetical protein
MHFGDIEKLRSVVNMNRSFILLFINEHIGDKNNINHFFFELNHDDLK